jgi:hypothetical protein
MTANNFYRSFNITYGDKSYNTVIELHTQTVLVSKATLARLFGWDVDHAPEKLKAKSLKTFNNGDTVLPKFQKIKAWDKDEKSHQVSVIPFSYVPLIAAWQASQGNQNAIALLTAGLFDSFTSIALEQAGFEIDAEERNRVLGQYLDSYHTWTDIIRDRHYEFYGFKPDRNYYRRINMKTDMVLFGVPSFGSNRKKNCKKEEQETLDQFQRFLKRRANQYPELEPAELLDEALRSF